jgi:hypothetical protein
MKLRIIAVRDRAADCFSQPQFVLSLGAAIRAFGDQINDNKDSELAKHPEDFDLYELGEFDDGNADFSLLGDPRQIAIGKDLKRSANDAS